MVLYPINNIFYGEENKMELLNFSSVQHFKFKEWKVDSQKKYLKLYIVKAYLVMQYDVLIRPIEQNI